MGYLPCDMVDIWNQYLWLLLCSIALEVGLDGVGVQSLFLEVSNQGRDVAVGDTDALGAGGVDGVEQAGPVGVIGHDEAGIDISATFRAADGHPAGGTGSGDVAELIKPGSGVGGRWREDHAPFPESFKLVLITGVNVFVRWESDTYLFKTGKEVGHGAVYTDGTLFRVEAGEDALRFAQGIGKDDAALLLFLIGFPPAMHGFNDGFT